MAINKNAFETQLIRDYLAGVNGADRKIYDYFADTLFAICLRYAPDEDSAKDFFQDAFIRVFQKLPEFRFEGSLEGWVKRICVNNCLDSIRRKAVIKEAPLEVLSDENIEVSEQISGNLEMKQLLSLLLRLPIGYRTVFNMYVIEGYAHAEIAKELNISENTSKSQLFKARKQLQQWLENEGK